QLRGPHRLEPCRVGGGGRRRHRLDRGGEDGDAPPGVGLAHHRISFAMSWRSPGIEKRLHAIRMSVVWPPAYIHTAVNWVASSMMIPSISNGRSDSRSTVRPLSSE